VIWMVNILFYLIQEAPTLSLPTVGPWGTFAFLSWSMLSTAMNFYFAYRSKTTAELKSTVDIIKDQATATEKEMHIYKGKAERLERENSEQKARISSLEAKTDITGIMANLASLTGLLNDQVELTRKWDREHSSTQSAMTTALERLMQMEQDDHKAISETITEMGNAVRGMQGEIRELVHLIRQPK
jgi:predicted  nucleic acid-binding Zn-ribbon protein